MFFKAAGSSEKYTTATTGASDFTDLMNKAASVCTKTNGGSDYWQMIIADKNNYSKLPLWKGGCAADINGEFPCPLSFNAVKYGKKQPQGAEAAAGGSNVLPFD